MESPVVIKTYFYHMRSNLFTLNYEAGDFILKMLMYLYFNDQFIVYELLNIIYYNPCTPSS